MPVARSGKRHSRVSTCPSLDSADPYYNQSTVTPHSTHSRRFDRWDREPTQYNSRQHTSEHLRLDPDYQGGQCSCKRACKVLAIVVACIVVVILYTLLGAVLFNWLEHGNEQDRMKQENETLVERREKFVSDVWRLLLPNCTDENCKQKLESLVEGFDAPSNLESKNYEKFSFYGSAFYSMTLYTTIGYGTTACATTAGRMVSLAYALIGIPLVMVVLGYVAVWIDTMILTFVNCVKRCIGCCGQEGEASFVPTMVSLVLLIIYCCCMVFVISHKANNALSNQDSFYFLLISLLTVGLGDVMPHPDFFLVATIFLLFGLALVANILASISTFIKAQFSKKLDKLQEHAEALAEKVAG